MHPNEEHEERARLETTSTLRTDRTELVLDMAARAARCALANDEHKAKARAQLPRKVLLDR